MEKVKSPIPNIITYVDVIRGYGKQGRVNRIYQVSLKQVKQNRLSQARLGYHLLTCLFTTYLPTYLLATKCFFDTGKNLTSQMAHILPVKKSHPCPNRHVKIDLSKTNYSRVLNIVHFFKGHDSFPQDMIPTSHSRFPRSLLNVDGHVLKGTSPAKKNGNFLFFPCRLTNLTNYNCYVKEKKEVVVFSYKEIQCKIVL